MMVVRRAQWPRHVRHITRFTLEREHVGKSPYVTREIRFRHRGERDK